MRRDALRRRGSAQVRLARGSKRLASGATGIQCRGDGAPCVRVARRRGRNQCLSRTPLVQLLWRPEHDRHPRVCLPARMPHLRRVVGGGLARGSPRGRASVHHQAAEARPWARRVSGCHRLTRRGHPGGCPWTRRGGGEPASTGGGVDHTSRAGCLQATSLCGRSAVVGTKLHGLEGWGRPSVSSRARVGGSRRGVPRPRVLLHRLEGFCHTCSDVS